MAAHLAIESPRVRTDIVEATEFPSLARRFNVYAVPKVVINETHEFVGALPEPHFVAAVGRAVAGDGEAAPAEGPVAGETTPLDPDGRGV
ncbi:MAG: thioredoxin family protein [Armatimonadetes bacterium]|nr:thioredoxin family protein [Armatimonadota bacterium]